jgi:hypothetical protein
MNIDAMVQAAQKKLAQWINRSAGQHKRALKNQTPKDAK